MKKQTVYIETSIISYLTSRPSRDLLIAANQKLTYDWWHKSKNKFDCYISDFVLFEISRGDKEASAKRLSTVQDIKLLEYTREIEELAQKYMEILRIPQRSYVDSVHLALSVWHKIDYLISWNCKHIANAIVLHTLMEYNKNNSLFVPILCTPSELSEV